MKKVFILILIIVFQFIGTQLYAQYSLYGGGDQQSQDTIPPKRNPNPGGEGEVKVYAPVDPNEIIGTMGYDALGDTLQWVAATASLPYTIYFENDPELAPPPRRRWKSIKYITQLKN